MFVLKSLKYDIPSTQTGPHNNVKPDTRDGKIKLLNVEKKIEKLFREEILIAIDSELCHFDIEFQSKPEKKKNNGTGCVLILQPKNTIQFVASWTIKRHSNGTNSGYINVNCIAVEFRELSYAYLFLDTLINIGRKSSRLLKNIIIPESESESESERGNESDDSN